MKEFFATRVMRRIVIFMLLTEFLWGLGSFFVLFTTTLTTYLWSLKASPLIIGVMSIAMSSLVLAPQLFGRTLLNRFRQRKRAIILIHLAAATPYLLIAVTHRVLAAEHPGLQIALAIVLLGFSQVTLALAVPVWMDMQAHVIPLHLRGRYYGLSAFFFAGGGVLGGLGFTALQRLLGPQVFIGAFLAAVACFALSMCAFALAPIPASAFAHPPEPSVWSRIAKSVRACHPRTDFGRLVLSNAVTTLAVTVVPFIMVFAQDKEHGLGYAGAEINGWVTICQALGSAGGGLLLGTLVDRIGPRLPWMAFTLLIPAAVLLAPHGQFWPLLALAFVLAGVLNTAWSVTGPAMLELSPPGDKSGYIAIANVIGFFPAVLGALLMGYSVKIWGYSVAFTLAAIFGAAAFLVALTLRRRAARPADTPAPETVGHP
ncbi:MAG: MFS transporter [Armatimonadota bacterium]